MQEGYPVAPLRERLAPRQAIETNRRDPACERARILFSGRDGKRMLRQGNGAERPDAAAAQCEALGLEADLVRGFNPVGKARLDLGERNWRGQRDPTLGGAAGDFSNRQEWLARQRRYPVDRCAASVRQ